MDELTITARTNPKWESAYRKATVLSFAECVRVRVWDGGRDYGQDTLAN